MFDVISLSSSTSNEQVVNTNTLATTDFVSYPWVSNDASCLFWSDVSYVIPKVKKSSRYVSKVLRKMGR